MIRGVSDWVPGNQGETGNPLPPKVASDRLEEKRAPSRTGLGGLVGSREMRSVPRQTVMCGRCPAPPRLLLLSLARVCGDVIAL